MFSIMSDLTYNRPEYTLCTALSWGQCADHWGKAGLKSCAALGHLAVALIESLPILGQLVSLIELAVSKVFFNLDPASGDPLPPRSFEEERVTVISIPESTELPYGGANAEYVMDCSELSRSEFDERAPLLHQQFPRPKSVETSLTGEKRRALEENECREIMSDLAREGVRAWAMPQTLYDLFYLWYRGTAALEAGVDPLCKRPVIDKGCFSGEIIRAEEIEEAALADNVKANRLQVEYGLHQFISAKLKEKGIEKLEWAHVEQLLEEIFDFFDQFPNEPATSFVAFTRSRDRYPAAAYRLIHVVTDRARQALKRSIWLEWTEDPAVRILYRSAHLSRDRLVKTDITGVQMPLSLSFGLSWLGSCENDCGYDGANPLVHLGKHANAYGLKVPATSEHDFVFVPPLQGTARYMSNGEATHPRTKFFFQEDEASLSSGGLTVKQRQFPFIFADRTKYDSEQEYAAAFEEFFKRSVVVLSGDDCPRYSELLPPAEESELSA